MALHMLTTVDNPFNPYANFDEWMAYDIQQGHNTLQLLARIARTSDELSDLQQEMAIEHAIEEIVRENVSGLHTSVEIPTAVAA